MSAHRVLIPGAQSENDTRTSIPIGSFVKWNKTGDQMWVVISATLGNYVMRSLPDVLLEKYASANYVNLTLVKSASDRK